MLRISRARRAEGESLVGCRRAECARRANHEYGDGPKRIRLVLVVILARSLAASPTCTPAQTSPAAAVRQCTFPRSRLGTITISGNLRADERTTWRGPRSKTRLVLPLRWHWPVPSPAVSIEASGSRASQQGSGTSANCRLGRTEIAPFFPLGKMSYVPCQAEPLRVIFSPNTAVMLLPGKANYYL
jgi:hypothetical protein